MTPDCDRDARIAGISAAPSAATST